MGLNQVAAGMVFLFIPELMLMDILPDVIGYLLIACGLAHLAYLDESIAVARRWFFRLALVAAAKPVAFVVTFGLADAFEQPTTLLLFTFVLDLLDCIWLIIAFNNLAEGLLYLGTRNGGTVVFNAPQTGKSPKKSQKGSGRSYTDAVFGFSRAFAVIRALCGICPELTSLIVDNSMQTYNYASGFLTWMLRVLCFTVSLTVGIVWLCRVEKYLRGLSDDAEFIGGLQARYTAEVAPNEALFERKRTKIILTVVGVAAFFAADIYVGGKEGISALPDLICAVGFLVGILMMRRDAGKLFAPAVAVISAYGAVASVTWILNYEFGQRYGSYAIRVNAEAYRAWQGYLILSVIEAMLFAASVWLICIVLCRVAERCTGYELHHADGYSSDRARDIHRALKRRLVVSAAFGTLAAVFGPLRVFSFRSASVDINLSWLASSTNKFLSSMAGVYNLFSLFQDVSWLLELAFTLLFAVIFAVTLYRINEEMKEKYMLL